MASILRVDWGLICDPQSFLIAAFSASRRDVVAKWLEQTLYRTPFEQSCANRLVSMRGDKDDRNYFPAIVQFLLEVRSCHSGHGDVKDEASGLVNVARSEKLFP